MDWIFANWEYILLGFFVAEKIVKITPWPQDDIIFDFIIRPIMGVLTTKKDE